MDIWFNGQKMETEVLFQPHMELNVKLLYPCMLHTYIGQGSGLT